MRQRWGRTQETAKPAGCSDHWAAHWAIISAWNIFCWCKCFFFPLMAHFPVKLRSCRVGGEGKIQQISFFSFFLQRDKLGQCNSEFAKLLSMNSAETVIYLIFLLLIHYGHIFMISFFPWGIIKYHRFKFSWETGHHIVHFSFFTSQFNMTKLILINSVMTEILHWPAWVRVFSTSKFLQVKAGLWWDVGRLADLHWLLQTSW